MAKKQVMLLIMWRLRPTAACCRFGNSMMCLWESGRGVGSRLTGPFRRTQGRAGAEVGATSINMCKGHRKGHQMLFLLPIQWGIVELQPKVTLKSAV